MKNSMTNLILQPVVALLIWSLVMWLWMLVTRLPAMMKQRVVLDPKLPPKDLTRDLPARVRWKADNYNHLLQQPVMFYAIALTLALLGAGEGLNLTLAWWYVGLRVVHTLHQTLWNKIEIRFVLFSLSSLVLIALIVRAALLIW